MTDEGPETSRPESPAKRRLVGRENQRGPDVEVYTDGERVYVYADRSERKERRRRRRWYR